MDAELSEWIVDDALPTVHYIIYKNSTSAQAEQASIEMFTLHSIVTKTGKWWNDELFLLFPAAHFYLLKIKNYSNFLVHSVIGTVHFLATKMRDSRARSIAQYDSGHFSFLSQHHNILSRAKHSGQEIAVIVSTCGERAESELWTFALF